MVQNPNQANLRSFVESKWISFQTWISGRFIIIQVISLISKSKLSLAFLFKFNEIIEVQCYFTVIQCIYDKHNYMIILCVYIWLQDEGVCISAYPFHRANTCCTKIPNLCSCLKSTLYFKTWLETPLYPNPLIVGCADPTCSYVSWVVIVWLCRRLQHRVTMHFPLCCKWWRRFPAEA